LPQWESQRQDLEKQLGTGSADYQTLEGLTRALADISQRINHGEERWLELSELTD
jgi:ABC transport system ATP-binding/permease protein